MNVENPGSWLLRWRIQLEECGYGIVYKSRSQNTNEDALSKIGSVTAETKSGTKLDGETKKQIVYEFHDTPFGGHRGMNKIIRTI
jgi:hypothetical protein